MPCPEVVAVFYIRPAEVPTLFSVEGDTRVKQQNTVVGFLTYSDKALFDELYFPKCLSGDKQGETHGTTCLNRPASNQPPYNASDDTTSGDLDLAPPEPPKRRHTLQPDGVDAAPPDNSEKPAEQHALPPMPDPVPAPPEPRRSRSEEHTSELQSQ